MNNSYISDEKIRNIIKYKSNYFLNKENVIGVGLGVKNINGFRTGRKCITVFVTKKMPLNRVYPQDVVPSVYGNIPTDVVQGDIPVVSSLRKRIRPAIGGYSIGVDGLNPGSIGCLVGDDNKDYILTCNHVIAGNSEKSINKVVVQPAPNYGGKAPKDVVGIVSKFIPVNITNAFNYVDAALVETDRSKASIGIDFIGLISSINFNPEIGESVKKVGSTTELTMGVVKTKFTSVKVDFLGRRVLFDDQITTTKMSDSGDSGSILLDYQNRGIGLLMAENSNTSIYNNFMYVLNQLKVKVLRH